jgi:site-specific DNA-cytosine methylase
LHGNPAPRRKTGKGTSKNAQGRIGFGVREEVSVAVCRSTSTQVEGSVACYDYLGTQGGGVEIGIAPTLKKKDGIATITQSMAVRRLTPVECERLQGFPDNFTRIPWRNKPATECPDGPRYKALGNSMAVPVMRWIGERIQQFENLKS